MSIHLLYFLATGIVNDSSNLIFKYQMWFAYTIFRVDFIYRYSNL
jgi:hypothetical protein